MECKKSLYTRFAHDSCKTTMKSKLDLLGVQEVRWDGGGTEPAGNYTFFYGNENLI
jgi:hypothetical protein